ncbi:unnamed protein product [Phytophthora fragariaefolia]|uniref:Unnamed protein product n=1 Tax=Phytophthora fragariaefolia TaxID=1490495 RepID=A0A9W7DG23_9STRA|nr:unnamed protein product [Phytophthora fragariaefolia]
MQLLQPEPGLALPLREPPQPPLTLWQLLLRPPPLSSCPWDAHIGTDSNSTYNSNLRYSHTATTATSRTNATTPTGTRAPTAPPRTTTTTTNTIATTATASTAVVVSVGCTYRHRQQPPLQQQLPLLAHGYYCY